MPEVHFSMREGGGATDIGQWIMEGVKVCAYHYPYCCTGLVLAQLGGSANEYRSNTASLAKLKKEVEAWIKYFTIGEGSRNRKQFISVCTTNEQTQANKVLRELGFTKSRWMANHKYEGTKLATWTLPIGHIKKAGA
jgi:hypothetical protein